MTAVEKSLSLLLFFGCVTGVRGQTSPTGTDGETFVPAIYTKIIVFTPNGCGTGREEAMKLISNRQIHFPMSVESSLTLRKLLDAEYGILDKGYNNGTCFRVQGDEECFYETMRIEIEKKWGKGFLAMQQRFADELDKEGRGYVGPVENGTQELLDRYLAENAPGRLDQKGYSIVLKISPYKRIIDLEVLSGGLFTEKPIPRNSWVYTFLKGALDNIPISCEPARLRGKPIESLIYLHAWF